MPAYEFRCKSCGEEFTSFYKSYAAYDAATPTCPNCLSHELARVIRRVSVQQPSRNYTSMTSKEMLSVLESGDNKQVADLYNQVGSAGSFAKNTSNSTTSE
ncbi:MAG: zinc ribbon domain-containing protein [Anaerolineae bacterium]|nr:zinc ribbon domain-containing protein [Anaerolineae bacterium]